MATLNFKGKTFVQNYHLTVKYHQLVPKKDKSLTDKVSLNDNLIVHGDNLKALKALLPTYAGKVKCIYIDPPYNTGNERWVYNDNVNSPMMQEWLGKAVDRDDLTRHDKWLCMMMPRLKLLRELLREDGVIFVSIDENEQQRLRLLMEEIFNDNHIATFAWTGRSGKGGTTSQVEMNHEYVECFARDSNKVSIKPVIRIQPEGRFSDKKGSYTRERLRQWGQGDRREDRPRMYFPIPTPDGGMAYPIRPDGSEGRWRFGEGTVFRMLEADDLDFEKNEKGGWEVFRKIRAGQERISAADSLLDEVGTASTGTIELKTIFNGKKVLETVKPSRLVRYLIDLVTWEDNDAIIIDSFAGSGTTAHAVLDLNKEDGGNRKFILVECEEYADKIAAERVRRVIKGVKNAKDEKLRNGLEGTFSYFELGDPIEMESILEGNKLPSFLELARYVFYTATGEEFDPKKVEAKKNFIGESKEYEVYLLYKPDIEYLKATALTLEKAKTLGPYRGKRRLIFAPSKYLDTDYLLEYRIDYCQLPFEIYKLKE
ncbi:site-specific DNA-methyltransferase [candidate division WOR-3 bacterium]|nr:site-specific DNA-methyltransferase [candidate division WOR-3 bacterium]